MKNGQNGFSDIIANVFGGIIIGVMLAAFRQIPAMESYFWMFDLFGLIGFAALIIAIPKWSIGYIAAWFFGAYVLWSAGLMHIQETVVYIITPAIIIFIKFYLFVRGENSNF